MKKNQPAFPIHPNVFGDDVCEFKGMSLRDYFAAQALTGMLAYSINNAYNQSNGTVEDIAQGAYRFADAMLAEREK